MRMVIILSCVPFLAVAFGCRSDEEALKSCLKNNDNRGALRAVKRMIASGADVNKRTMGGIAPLHFAAGAEDIEFAKLLIAKGADVNVKADNGFTPLNFTTCFSDHSDSTTMVKLLLKHGANPNSDNKNCSPLMSACQNACYEIVRVLIENGADVNLANDGKDTPLLYANDVRIIKYLISKGADVKAKNQDGRTVLMQVACCVKINDAEKKEMILLLIEKGVPINAVEQSFIELKYGLAATPYTALDWAISNKQPEEIISLLRSRGAKTAAELKAESGVEKHEVSSGDNE